MKLNILLIGVLIWLWGWIIAGVVVGAITHIWIVYPVSWILGLLAIPIEYYVGRYIVEHDK